MEHSELLRGWISHLDSRGPKIDPRVTEANDNLVCRIGGREAFAYLTCRNDIVSRITPGSSKIEW